MGSRVRPTEVDQPSLLAPGTPMVAGRQRHSIPVASTSRILARRTEQVDHPASPSSAGLGRIVTAPAHATAVDESASTALAGVEQPGHLAFEW